MNNFRIKDIRKGGKNAIEFVKKYPVVVSAGTLAMSTGNLVTNLSRKKSDRKYQDKQLDAMNRLTNALTEVDKTLKNPIKPNLQKPEQKKKSIFSPFNKFFSDSNKMIKFRQKDFSISSDTIKGAQIGAGIGSFGSIMLPKSLKNNIKVPFLKNRSDLIDKTRYNNLNPIEKKLGLVAAGTLIGASLGALVGLIKEGSNYISRKRSGSDRLMENLVSILKKSSFNEGKDFTRDPKIANDLRTKVCIVITKVSGDLKLLINTISDQKLKRLTDEIIENLPNFSVINNKVSDRFNEITISSISDGSADAGLIAGICDRFIHSGYPVYLVEVG